MLANFSEFFIVKIVPSEHSDSGGVDGRPEGGLAMAYRKTLKNTVKPINENIVYCLHIISQGCEVFHVVNIYMPCDLRDLESINISQILLRDFPEIFNSLDLNKILFAEVFNANRSTSNKVWLNL